MTDKNLTTTEQTGQQLQQGLETVNKWIDLRKLQVEAEERQHQRDAEADVRERELQEREHQREIESEDRESEKEYKLATKALIITTIIAIAILVATVAAAFFFRNIEIIDKAITLAAGLIGGYGFGRYKRTKAAESEAE